MADNNKAVGPLATAKLVALIKSALNGKLDKTGGTIFGDLKVKTNAEGTGNIDVDGEIRVKSGTAHLRDVHATGTVHSDLMAEAPLLNLRAPLAEKSVQVTQDGDTAVKMECFDGTLSNGYARLEVGTPTGDNDAATKAYVDSKVKKDFVVTITPLSPSDVPTSVDGGIAQFTATCDKTFAEIKGAIDAGKNVLGNYGGNIWPLSRATDTMIAIDGTINLGYFGDTSNATCSFVIQSNGIATITCAAGELPAVSNKVFNKVLVANNGHWDLTDTIPSPNSDGSDNGKVPTVNGNRWELKNVSKEDFVVNITFNTAAPPSIIDDANLAVFNASTDKTFAEISSAVAGGKNIYGVWNNQKWPLALSAGGRHVFRGSAQLNNLFGTVGIATAACVVLQNTCYVEVSAGELPVPALDGSDDGKGIVVSGNKWAMKKPVVDDALSDTSTNPVQNKAVKTALDGKAGTSEATTGAAGLMSAADKTKLDGVEAGANKTTVDAALDAASENPVQNKAVKAALDGKLSTLGGEISGHLEVGQTVSAEGSVSVGRTSTDTGIHFEKAASDAGRISHGSDPMTGVSPIARLKVAAPTEDDDAATKAYVDNNAAGAGAVRYDAEQTLEVAQQFQARKNIGAVGHNSPQFQGFLALAPANAPLGTGVGLSPSGSGNDFTLDISDVNEGTPTLLTGVKTPTNANTNAAATVEYVLGKALPAVTTADNGKILKVVNGAWQAVYPD